MIGLFVATTSLGPMRTGFFMNFEPIATVLLAVPILGQEVQPIQMAGAVLVIVALFLFRPLKLEREKGEGRREKGEGRRVKGEG